MFCYFASSTPLHPSSVMMSAFPAAIIAFREFGLVFLGNISQVSWKNICCLLCSGNESIAYCGYHLFSSSSISHFAVVFSVVGACYQHENRLVLMLNCLMFAQHDGSAKEVAVKTLRENSSQEERLKFLQEAAIMGQFKHCNVVQLYGVVAQESPVRILQASST